MKCILYWVWEKDAVEGSELIDLVVGFENAKAASPEVFPRMSVGMSLRMEAGFKLVEGTQEQLLNLVVYWERIRGWQLVYFEPPDMLIPFTA
jgi:hypothetical protein